MNKHTQYDAISLKKSKTKFEQTELHLIDRIEQTTTPADFIHYKPIEITLVELNLNKTK